MFELPLLELAMLKLAMLELAASKLWDGLLRLATGAERR